MIEKLPDGSYLMDGMTSAEEALEILKIHIPEEDEFENVKWYTDLSVRPYSK